jgi:hypothetical protein
VPFGGSEGLVCLFFLPTARSTATTGEWPFARFQPGAGSSHTPSHPVARKNRVDKRNLGGRVRLHTSFGAEMDSSASVELSP